MYGDESQMGKYSILLDANTIQLIEYSGYLDRKFVCVSEMGNI